MILCVEKNVHDHYAVQYDPTNQNLLLLDRNGIVENILPTKHNTHPVDVEYNNQFLTTFSPFGDSVGNAVSIS